MLELIRNTIAFITTFVVIMTTTMLCINIMSALFRENWKCNPRREKIEIIIGFLLAVLLIPFYYYPC